MKKIYQVYDGRQPDGSWYKVFEVPEEMSLPHGYIDVAPPDDLINPKFIFGEGWIEDESALVDKLTKENADLHDRLEIAEGAIIEIANSIFG